MFNCAGFGWHGHGFGGFGGIGMWVTTILFWGLIIAGIVLIIRAIKNQSGKKSKADNSAALEILEKRYARGEIDKEEFEAKKADLDY